MKTRQTDEFLNTTGQRVNNLSGLIDVVRDISRERTEILAFMKAALQRGDDDEALERARELTGLPTKRETTPRS
jgi:hypothetical protein